MLQINSSSVKHDPESKQCLTFPRIENNIEYDYFFRHFMETNTPCIFSQNLTKEWCSRKDWVTNDGSPNIDYFDEEFGSCEVPVAHCGQKHFDSQQKETFVMQDYVSYMKLKDESDLEFKKDCLYMKDWHFVKAFPKQLAYRTPLFFGSDWLNEFWEAREDAQDDYRFVYMGPRGSWTPFHCDVFQSYSWSANVCGRKKWVFFPPGEEEALKDSYGSLVYDVADETNCVGGGLSRGTTVIQEPGETIFVPSGWHHQVWNLEDTISINHNWINATNIDRVWTSLQAALEKVEESISDCRSMDKWEDQCQLLLKATHGMDLIEYYAFIRAIARRRLDALNKGEDVIVLDGYTQNKNHSLYDLTKLKQALERLLDDPRLPLLDGFQDLQDSPSKLMDDIHKLL